VANDPGFSPSGVLDSERRFIPARALGRNSELGRGPPNPPDTALAAPGPRPGRGEAEVSRPLIATLEEAWRGWVPKDGELIPRPEKPLAAPVAAGGGPSD
jgi:hypothetical protein